MELLKFPNIRRQMLTKSPAVFLKLDFWVGLLILSNELEEQCGVWQRGMVLAFIVCRRGEGSL